MVELDASSGKFSLVSKHFPLTVSDLIKYQSSGSKLVIDIDTLETRVKRKLKHEDDEDIDKKHHQLYEEQEIDGQDEALTDEEVRVFKRALDIIKNSGRGKDFVAVLAGVASGTILSCDVRASYGIPSCIVCLYVCCQCKIRPFCIR